MENLDTLREVAPVKTFSSWKMIDRVRAIGGRFTLRRKRLLEDASTYRGEAVVFERLSSVVKEAGFAPEVVMATALRLQDLHNRQDIKWLEELGVQRDLIPEILLRLVQRGGSWLDFVEILVGFKGDMNQIQEE